MVFQHSGGGILTIHKHSHYSGVIPMVFQAFNIVGGDILTIPDTPTTQGLSLWCFNIVGGEILTNPRHSHYSGVIPMVFQHSEGRDFDRHGAGEAERQ